MGLNWIFCQTCSKCQTLFTWFLAYKKEGNDIFNIRSILKFQNHTSKIFFSFKSENFDFLRWQPPLPPYPLIIDGLSYPLVKEYPRFCSPKWPTRMSDRLPRWLRSGFGLFLLLGNRESPAWELVTTIGDFGLDLWSWTKGIFQWNLAQRRRIWIDLHYWNNIFKKLFSFKMVAKTIVWYCVIMLIYAN